MIELFLLSIIYCAFAIRPRPRHLPSWLAEQSYVPHIAVAMMVKDEVHSMPLSMRSLIDAGIRTLIIYDTGSTDGTQALIRTLAQIHHIELEMKQGKFVDFATSRNVLLKFARHKSRWLFLLDAGDQLMIDGPLQLDDRHCGYLVMQVWSATSFFNTRLIRNDVDWRWLFPVHEYLSLDDGKRTCARASCASSELPTLGDSVRLVQDRTISGRSSQARWTNDAAVLRNVLLNDPTNPRALFYLANTYKQLNQCDEAVPLYKKRIDQRDRGWWEEREVSMINIIECVDDEESDKWALRLYIENGRIEGLMRLARRAMDRDDDASLCFAIADIACRVPRPNRLLFFHAKEYDEYRFNLRDFCRNRIEKARNQFDAN